MVAVGTLRPSLDILLPVIVVLLAVTAFFVWHPLSRPMFNIRFGRPDVGDANVSDQLATCGKETLEIRDEDRYTALLLVGISAKRLERHDFQLQFVRRQGGLVTWERWIPASPDIYVSRVNGLPPQNGHWWLSQGTNSGTAMPPSHRPRQKRIWMRLGVKAGGLGRASKWKGYLEFKAVRAGVEVDVARAPIEVINLNPINPL